MKISDCQINDIMEDFANRNGLTFVLPFTYLNYLLDERTMQESFRKVLKVMQSLENIRNQSILGKEYDVEVVQMIVNCNHPLQQKMSLQDIFQMFPDWTKDSIEPLCFNIKEILR